jgi:glycosyltransferase involved in cell wall biosynthesis
MTARPAPRIAFVIPCYNEEATLAATLDEVLATLDRETAAGALTADSYILCVDDGSADRTWALIEEAAAAPGARVRGLKLARNVGHQNALLAGLLTQIGKVDATLSLDADLQDDIAVIPAMIAHYRNGAEIVFAVRNERRTDNWFKRGTAGFYYRVLKWLGADIIPHHADFRLMSDAAMRALSQFGEVHVFLRGLVRQLGFPTATVEFSRAARRHGETKYTLPKMVGLAVNGITSLSVTPIRLIALLGIIMFIIFMIAAAWVFVTWLAGHTVQGWTSVMLLFILIAAFQTTALAVIGEYVGKIYFEAKSRPRYIVERETTGAEKI